MFGHLRFLEGSVSALDSLYSDPRASLAPPTVWLLLMLFLAPTLGVSGESPGIPFTDSEIRVDAHLDEEAWQDALRLELPYETEPAENAEARVRTEALLLYSDTHLYVAFRAHDPEPEKIRARYRERDNIFGQDMVSLTLDPYHGQRRGYQFFVNPLGVQADLLINELAGTEDSSFEAIWDSAGRLTEDGYVVEMKIPLNSIRFPTVDGEMQWGLDLVRFYPRNYSHRFALSPLERGRDCYLCQVRTVSGMTANDRGRALELTPEFSVSGREAPGEQDGEIERDTNLGGTAQWAVTPGMTLTGTVNPDFSQVAADRLQLDINQPFGVQRQERRPFFQESADLFETPMNTVQTRNMVDPSSGVKLAGQMGGQALGVFHVRDRQLNVIRPGVEGAEFERLAQPSESSALRYQTDVLDESAVGVLATRRSAAGYDNSVLALDGQLRFSGRDTLRYQWARSETEDQLENGSAAPGALEGNARRVRYQHERRHIYTGARHEHRDPGFRADLGFLPQTGFRENRGWIGTRWFGQGTGLLQEADFRVEHRRSDVVADGRPLERRDSARLELEGTRQSRWILFGQQHERWQEGRRFEGERWFSHFQFEPVSGLQLRVQGDGGQQIDFVGLRDGRSRRIEPGIQAELGQHLDLDLRYQRQHLDVDEGRLFETVTRELRAGWYFGVRTYLRLISQWSEIERNAALYPEGEGDDRVSWVNQLTLTWRLDPRTEFIAGYSDQRSGADRDTLSLEERQMFMKLSYAWQV